jgi:hypothetical protein
MVDTQELEQIITKLKVQIEESPPLELMERQTLLETLSHDNIHYYTPHQCFYISPFDINGGLLPLTELSLGFSLCLHASMLSLQPFISYI